ACMTIREAARGSLIAVILRRDPAHPKHVRTKEGLTRSHLGTFMTRERARPVALLLRRNQVGESWRIQSDVGGVWRVGAVAATRQVLAPITIKILECAGASARWKGTTSESPSQRVGRTPQIRAWKCFR